MTDKTEVERLNAYIATVDAKEAATLLTEQGFRKWAEGKEDLTLDDVKPEYR